MPFRQSDSTVVKWRLSRIKTPSDEFSVHLTASGAIFVQLHSVWRTNVASLRRKPFRPPGLATACQQCCQSTQDSPVYRVGYVFFQGGRFPDCFEVELPNVIVLDLRIEGDGWSR